MENGHGGWRLMVDAQTVIVRLLWTGGGARAGVGRLLGLLSAEEVERAGRFLREEPQEQFVLGRALLRVVLGEMLQVAPRSVPVAVDALGKPSTPGVEFNLSHTEGLVGVAVTRGVAVGLDLERADAALEVMEVARTAFASADVARLEATAEEDRAKVFYELWTEREAIAKCLGLGIADPAAMRGEWGGAEIGVSALDLEAPFHGCVAFQNRLPLAVNMARFPVEALLQQAS